MRRTIISALLVLISTTAVAAGTGTGRIVGYVPSTSGGRPEFVLVTTETISGTAPCNTTGRFGLSSSDPKYKSVFASIVAAYHAGTEVHIFGLGTCDVFSNAEDISYICFGSIAC